MHSVIFFPVTAFSTQAIKLLLSAKIVALGFVLALCLLTGACSSDDEPAPGKLLAKCSGFVAAEKLETGQETLRYSAWLEAEDAEHNLMVRTPRDDGFTESSGDRYLRMEKNGQLYVRWNNIAIEKTGLTDIEIRGAAPWGSKEQRLHIIDESGKVVFSMDKALGTEAFKMLDSDDNPKTWATYSINARLKKGVYDILVKDDWGFAFFDALRVSQSEVILDSQLSLSQINYFQKHDNVLALGIAYNFNRLVGFEINGQPVDYTLSDDCNEVTLDNAAFRQLPEGEYPLKAVFNRGQDAELMVRVSKDIVYSEAQRYEAEWQSFSNDVLRARAEDDEAGVSNQEFVQYNSTGTIEFTVDVAKAGKYDMTLRYRSLNKDGKRQLQINGTPLRPAIGFRIANDWDTTRFSLPFQQGINRVTIGADDGEIHFDYLQLGPQPVNRVPEVHGQTNRAYLGDTLVPIRIKVDPFNQKLLSVTGSGQTLDYNVVDSIIDGIEILEDGFWIEIPTAGLEKLGPGHHTLNLQFDDGANVPFHLTIHDHHETHEGEMTLIVFDVSHGTAVLMQLPDNTHILVDTGKSDMFDHRVLPFLQANGLHLDEVWTSHRHGDHYGGIERIQQVFPHAVIKNNQSLDIWQDQGCTPGGETPFKRGDTLRYGDALIEVLNAHGDQCQGNYLDFNPNSLAFRLSYAGFHFAFQGDIYGQQQDELMQAHPADKHLADVFLGNHHFHGSISPEYVKKSGADLLIISASEHVHRAGSFTQDGMEAINWLKANNTNFKEHLFTFDVGHTVIKVGSDGDWTYETIATREVKAGSPWQMRDLKAGNLRRQQTQENGAKNGTKEEARNRRTEKGVKSSAATSSAANNTPADKG